MLGQVELSREVMRRRGRIGVTRRISSQIESDGSKLVKISEQNMDVAEEVGLNVVYAKANRSRKNLNDFSSRIDQSCRWPSHQLGTGVRRR